MEFINEFLQSYSSANIIYAYALLLSLTLIGIVPSNSDLVIITGAILVINKSLSLELLFLIVLGLVFVLETSTFLLGSRLGSFITEQKLILKIFPKSKIEKISALIEDNPRSMLISIRITPFMRPLFYLIIGALGFKRSYFLKYHLIIALIYNSILIGVTYFIAESFSKLKNTHQIIAYILIFIIWFSIIHKLKKNFNKRL